MHYMTLTDKNKPEGGPALVQQQQHCETQAKI